jgi:DNA-binding MarR family transcriptional regulator
MNRGELLKNLIEKFLKAAHNMHSNQNFPFGDFMLGRQQVMILFFIYENKGLASVKAIAKKLNVTPGAITQFVDGLVEKKLVIREENSRDRRSINIILAPDVEEKFNSFRQTYLTNASRSFTGLSDMELVEFIKLLEKIEFINPKF